MIHNHIEIDRTSSCDKTKTENYHTLFRLGPKRNYKSNHKSSISPFSSSCFLTPTVFGRPRPLRIGSDWLLARDLLLFSMSLVKEESILSLRMRSVLLRFNSSLSKDGNKENSNNNNNLTSKDFDWPVENFSFVW